MNVKGEPLPAGVSNALREFLAARAEYFSAEMSKRAAEARLKNAHDDFEAKRALLAQEIDHAKLELPASVVENDTVVSISRNHDDEINVDATKVRTF